MYESRSAIYKMMLPEAAKNRKVMEMPKAFKLQASPYLQTEFIHLGGNSESKNPSLSCLRIAKAIFLGDVAVGKTCIINRFCHEAYDHDYKATIGVDFEVERFDIMHTPFNIQIWDTAGQERFKSIASSYYRGAHIVAIVFDLTSIHSLISCDQWLKDAISVNPQSPLIFLIGNKMDLLSQSSRSEMEKIAMKTASKLGAEFWPVSALTGENVDEIFRRMAALAFNNLLQREAERHHSPVAIGTIDVGLVVGSGHIYVDTFHAFHDVSACYTPYRLMSVGLYLDLAGNIEQHPLDVSVQQPQNEKKKKNCSTCAV